MACAGVYMYQYTKTATVAISTYFSTACKLTSVAPTNATHEQHSGIYCI